MAVDVRDDASLPPDVRGDLARALSDVATLEDVVHWALAMSPPRALVDIIVQDEFTHDVVMKWTEEHYLVFDAT